MLVGDDSVEGVELGARCVGVGDFDGLTDDEDGPGRVFPVRVVDFQCDDDFA